ncbi:hypothetical protein SS1G_02515 [Sclerotinia sclerotiorum 1980 UF-70]|uniref:Ketoreductase (KR) domain-containing protein n=1 Tax=Sclerotinia sclerotiorum (strain ATCC 18683 / 1980 / Ss-1) TaxID=665079 RepID=A7EB29_SCLS1|nr:hypothetical protein SS1G_02515 [Sclerotinia sclerotiorum 1980 UF-70]EDN99657.1 hypothetical protein SS1G_02515 [Sclerotinia sclerotiorum 1980 UF-70]
MSMVLRDGGYPQMTHNDWEIVQAPKAQGTWNFHSATNCYRLSEKIILLIPRNWPLSDQK